MDNVWNHILSFLHTHWIDIKEAELDMLSVTTETRASKIVVGKRTSPTTQASGQVYGLRIDAIDVIKLLVGVEYDFMPEGEPIQSVIEGKGGAAELLTKLLHTTSPWTKKMKIQVHIKNLVDDDYNDETDEVDLPHFYCVIGIMYKKARNIDYEPLHIQHDEILQLSRMKENLNPSTFYTKSFLERGLGDDWMFENLRYSQKRRDFKDPQEFWEEWFDDLDITHLEALVNLRDLIDLMYAVKGIEKDVSDVICTFNN